MSNEDSYTLRLYIAGITIDNQESILDFKQSLKDKLGEHYSLEVVDILENPELSEDDKIIATPTIVRTFPDPVQKVILNFNNKEKLLLGMDLLIDK